MGRFEEKVLKSMHIIRFRKTKYGLKNVGASYLLNPKIISSESIVELSSDLLYLGPDFLKNRYTLLDCHISQSPHYDLIKTISEGGNLASTDYIKRFVSGKLDWRRGYKQPRDYNFFMEKFAKSTNEIEHDDYKPVLVYKLGGKYYIYDGKHRAALCALLGLPVKCLLLGNDIANANVWHYMFSIIKDDLDYSCHTEYHNKYLKELKEYGKE